MGSDRLAELAPDDEYDRLVLPLLGRLYHGADRAAISAYLKTEVGDPSDHDIDAIADRLVTWWAAARTDVRDVRPDASGPG
ncbi:hypothetical protein [Virgisporangium ochraceum]|uniref:hypothetical protein n=1 Tax=Virgisporangium ochraceum TaxID=65505 RepID=UPI001940CA64|nr:hypothetical protein [Virgisporangium ochraceum]